MTTFHVTDMTCGHCAGLINKALKTIDDESRITIDLEHHLVSVETTQSTIEDIREAIAEAGYTSTPVEAKLPDSSTERPVTSVLAPGTGDLVNGSSDELTDLDFLDTMDGVRWDSA